MRSIQATNTTATTNATKYTPSSKALCAVLLVVYVQQPKTNGLAVASLVLGIIWIYWIGSILALIFGYNAKGQIDRSNAMQGGRGLAVAGIVLGWVGVGTLAFVLIVALITSVSN